MQESLSPTRDDDGLCEEVRRLIVHMKAIFTTIAFGRNRDFDEKLNEELGELGVEVAEEAGRRVLLVQQMENRLWMRWDTLRKQLGEKEAA